MKNRNPKTFMFAVYWGKASSRLIPGDIIRLTVHQTGGIRDWEDRLKVMCAVIEVANKVFCLQKFYSTHAFNISLLKRGAKPESKLNPIALRSGYSKVFTRWGDKNANRMMHFLGL